MKMSGVDQEFCSFCGFLKQLKTMVKCKSCINKDTELTNIKSNLHKCVCEYCLGVGFKVPKDLCSELIMGDNALKHLNGKKHANEQDSKTGTNKGCEQSMTEQECDWNVDASDWNVDVSDWNVDVSAWNDNDDWGSTQENILCDCREDKTYPYTSDWGDPVIDHVQDTEVMTPSDETQQMWMKEQNVLKQKLILEDNSEIRKLKQAINNENYSGNPIYFGGMDISFVKGDAVNACAALVVLSFPDLKVVYEDYEMVKLTEPYIPGFLAFREAGFLIDLYNKLVFNQPQYTPDVIFLDGNGILHPREFGLASYVGVVLHTPCLGVAKNLIHIDGLENNDEFKALKTTLKKGGDTVPLKNGTGKTLGMALRSLDSTTNPIYVSCGHLLCLDTAVMLVKACCKYRIPEPVRQADLNSREFLRKAGLM